MIGKFKTISPITIDFALTPDALVGNDDDYTEFWDHVQSEATNNQLGLKCDELEFSHAEFDKKSQAYKTLGEDSLKRPLHIMRIVIPRDGLDFTPQSDDETTWEYLDEVECWICNHSVGLLQMRGEFPSETQTNKDLDKLQASINSLSTSLTKIVHDNHIKPLIDLVREIDKSESFISEPVDLRNVGLPWWTARSLQLDMRLACSKAIARHWLQDSAEPETIEQFCNQEITHVSQWLNYVHRLPESEEETAGKADEPIGNKENEDPTKKSTEGAWRAMLYSQYFYAALDQVDSRLNRVLAETIQGRSVFELRELEDQLRILSHRAEQIMLDRQELLKYVARPVRDVFQSIMKTWDHQGLVEEPVRFKITICDRRLAELNTDSQARANTVTDVILLAIGVTSILGTALALSSFGRSMATDPSQAGYGSATSAITEWFAAQPADSIVIGSLLISALLVALFIAIRRSS